MTRRIVVALCLLLAMPASAHAATLVKTGSTLTYTGAGAAPSSVTFTEGPAGTVVVARDTTGDSDAITTTGCTETVPGTQFTCPGITVVAADGRDGDDALSAAALTAARAALSGGAGNDSLTGGAGADTVDGGDGDDTLAGNAGADSITGGAGIDRVDYGGAAPAVSLNDVADDGSAGEGDNVHSDVEDVTVSPSSGSSTIAGSADRNTLTVASGSATITGGAGSDTFEGGPAADTIDARDGYTDRVSCGGGADTVMADQFDQVYSNCENVTREPVAGGDDRPPTVAWTAPSSGASLSAGGPTTLAVDAADDRGVAKVQFFDDDRLVCEDTAAPYTCAYAPRGGDVGRDTLSARAIDTADQSASAIQAITVNRFSARSLSLKLGPTRDRKAPYRFNVSGALGLPTPVARTQGCHGQVTITVKSGTKTVATRHASVSRVCEYKLRITFSHRPGKDKLKFSARFTGNDVMAAKSATSRTGRTR